jgi:hypothetical protein
LQQETTNRLTRRIFWLTIALMVFAVVEIVLKVGPWVFGLFFK